MPESKPRKKKGSTPRKSPRPRRSPLNDLPPVDGIVRSIIRGGEELLTVDDPLDAELWASAVLGITYKQSLPVDVRDRFEELVWGGVLERAETQDSPASLAVLRALGAVASDPLASRTAGAADRLASRGVPEPAWAGEIGTVEFLRGWTLADPYGDQVAYFAHFRYPGRPEHLVSAVYDENLGGIIKDASAGILAGDPCARAEEDPDTTVDDVNAGTLATVVTAAIASGDMYLDNDWTPDFKELRALLLARMRPLPESFGPAKAMTNAMLADGVDLGDPEAMQACIDAFNARPFEERDAFLASAMPGLRPEDDPLAR